jgi:hypothetical membrane protein
MKNKRFGIIGLSAPLILGLTYMIMSAQRPEYSFLTKAISELGSLDAPNKWYFNVFGYILPGVLISIFSIGLYRSMAQKTSSRMPLIGIFLSGLFMAISGIFPGDFDDRTSSTMILHTVGSFGSYIFFLIGAFTYPKLMRESNYWKSVILLSLTLTWLTIIFGAWPFVFTDIPGVGQRIVFSLYFLWIALHAFKLYNYQSVIK